MSLLSKTTLNILIIFLFLINLTGTIFALDMDDIVAYPVPFNPGIHNNLRIGYKPGVTSTDPVNKIKIEIFDINGDTVLTREYTSLNAVWNGRNSKGKLVKSGMYIIKVSMENINTGAYGQKMIRILVNR
ncbi:MAG: T9SS type A sorting domain-containing protein [Spirochaetes bacterium]|nr:T9SS type A sorting domain-containing protein [Spirochaetota bacterium]